MSVNNKHTLVYVPSLINKKFGNKPFKNHYNYKVIQFIISKYNILGTRKINQSYHKVLCYNTKLVFA